MNSTISHQMRNPLNSIISQCKIMEQALRRFKYLIEQTSSRFRLDLKRRCLSLLEEIQQSNHVQVISSNLLLFQVEDILGLAQIKSGSFRKTTQKFDIKEAIEEVVEIQEYFANIKNVSISLELCNFPLSMQFSQQRRNYTVLTDKKRLQQVLINL